ncbi:UNVERIFIED_CONTAM: hypothetical protein RMT77_003000 [Armadillidium vulgare]
MILKICLLITLTYVYCFANPVDHYGPPKHKPPPKPYKFSYGVHDEYAGTSFGQNEQSDGKQVYGSYTVLLPDGRKQTVKYKADHYNGFVADVSYYGEAQYPSKSKYPPFIVQPQTYHPKESSYPEPPVYKPFH